MNLSYDSRSSTLMVSSLGLAGGIVSVFVNGALLGRYAVEAVDGGRFSTAVPPDRLTLRSLVRVETLRPGEPPRQAVLDLVGAPNNEAGSADDEGMGAADTLQTVRDPKRFDQYAADLRAVDWSAIQAILGGSDFVRLAFSFFLGREPSERDATEYGRIADRPGGAYDAVRRLVTSREFAVRDHDNYGDVGLFGRLAETISRSGEGND